MYLARNKSLRFFLKLLRILLIIFSTLSVFFSSSGMVSCGSFETLKMISEATSDFTPCSKFSYFSMLMWHSCFSGSSEMKLSFLMKQGVSIDTWDCYAGS